MVPFYDIRYRSNDIEVGDIFDQPDTQESRQRALRAREVASHIAEKMREIQERSLVSDTSEERVLNPLKMPKTPKTPNTFNHMGSCNSVLNNTM
ncbi:hypothetical protein EON65_10490 [archaeon]|nr:MAG: hypothetical protein EON65_10490 [archaeon]